MISKTSFFNKGIYKSTLKRYAWGAVLYFILLFMFTCLALFLSIDRDFSHMPTDYFSDYPVILHGVYIVMPILLAITVPTVVALLVFRFIHSKKQAIFTHSIPVSRKANYVSSVMAAFTLMCVPVLVNGVILIAISVCGYGEYFTVANCLQWIGYNLMGLYLMFSVAVFAACLTGNSFAAVAINVLIHSFVAVTALTLSVMADVFLHGYSDNSLVLSSCIESNFAVMVFGFSDRYFRNDITAVRYILYGAAALAMYVGAYFLYKRRRLETASDVAGYKCLNHIFKYIVTFLATMFAFAVFSSYIGENTAVFAVIMVIASVIAYAASEMVLKKTLNVFYAWKGYVGFAAFFVVLVLLFSETTFFGFETRIPAKEDIAEVTIYNYYHQENEPYTSDGELIDMITAAHGKLIDSEITPAYRDEMPTNTRMHIKYRLKNGKSIYRVYPVTSEQCVGIMNPLYENEEYKRKCEEVFVDDSAIRAVYVSNHKEDIEIDDYDELLYALREDVMELSFEDIYYSNESGKYLYSININHETDRVISEDGRPRATLTGIYMTITDKYERTVEWLRSHGYEENEYEEEER